MVKRTLVVLGILSLTLMVAGTSFGFMGGGCGSKCLPLYVPADCPDICQKTIVKTWQCKIEGPCPAPTPPCCGCNCGGGCDLCCMLTAIPNCFDVLFGGFDGVYGCCPGFDLGGGPCGSPFCGGCFPKLFAPLGLFANNSNVFGCLW